MDWELLFSFLGSAVACFAGILTSQKLTNFRIEQLEKKVDKHNNLIERMTALEVEVRELERRVNE